MKNNIFTIELNRETGNVQSIIINEDPDQMQWLGMTHEWGEIANSNMLEALYRTTQKNELLDFSEDTDMAVSVFSNGKLKTTITRNFTENGTFRESYTFENLRPVDLFIGRGELGIYTPFCDEWKSADISLKHRCNTHIWCGENAAWMNSLKQGESEYNIGVVLTEGAVDAYSIDRENQTLCSNTRGNIVMHPETIELLSGESFTLTWEMFVHKGTEDFINKLDEYRILYPTAERYTWYLDEPIEFTFKSCAENIDITLDGKAVPFTKKDGEIKVRCLPERCGEHKFYICADGKMTHVCFYVSDVLENVVKKRVRFIIEHQQYHRSGSHLNGAYLIYDNKEKKMIYDRQIPDHNACRERLAMPLLIARYLLSHNDPKAYESLMRFVEFMKREVMDFETGEVFDSEGKDRERVRLYNAPWAITLMAELYTLTEDEEYLEVLYKAVKFYYGQGGAKFYPNGFCMKLTLDALRKGNKNDYADEVQRLFAKHTHNMIEVGLNYPPMECIFEQTIVTPVVQYICEMGLITGKTDYQYDVQEHLAVLERFDGMQPDYRTNTMPIRYWDDYWFGKSELYADTLHYWSCLSAISWEFYYLLVGDEKYHKRANICMRNNLCMFAEDGSASCAYVLPFKVDGRAGDFYDEWANDQDFALYYMLYMENIL